MNLISVIVPIYNVEDYLDRCINSIINQTYKNLEIILVDDGSSDNCPELCDKWALIDSRIKVIHKENGGLSDARNAGMKISSGDYISFIDSDDWIADEMLERLFNSIKQTKSEIAICSVLMKYENDTSEVFLVDNKVEVLYRNEAQFELLYERKIKQPVCNRLYSASLLDNIEFEVGKYHEDVFWSYQVIAKANKVSLIDYCGYFYWQRNNSIMGEKYSLKRLDAMEAYCNRYKDFQKSFPELEKKALVAIWENCIYHGQMSMKYLTKTDRQKAFKYLNTIKSENRISFKDYSELNITHHFWLTIARISLELVCRIKNFCNVGF